MTGGTEANGEITPRQAEILPIVREQGFATVDAMARHFDVSAQSVRRDIIHLDQIGLLQRFHGGAGIVEQSIRLGYAEKRIIAAEAKTRIGQYAASLLPEGASVFLDVGTTVEAAARAMRGIAGLKVFTCSLASASILAGEQDIQLFVVGGSVAGPDGSLVGESAVEAVRQFRFDVSLIGFSGVDTDGALMDYDPAKIAVKQAAMRRSAAGIALGTSSKLGRPALMRLGPPGQIGTIVTDMTPPDPLMDLFDKVGTKVHRAA